MEVNRAIAPYVDVMIGNEEDFSAALGFEVPGLDEGCSKLDPSNFKKMIKQAVKTFPISRAWRPRYAMPRPPATTTGAPSSIPTVNSTMPSCVRTWTSSTAWVEAIALPRIDFWINGKQGTGLRRQLRCCPRCPGHDHPPVTPPRCHWLRSNVSCKVEPQESLDKENET